MQEVPLETSMNEAMVLLFFAFFIVRQAESCAKKERVRHVIFMKSKCDERWLQVTVPKSLSAPVLSILGCDVRFLKETPTKNIGINMFYFHKTFNVSLNCPAVTVYETGSGICISLEMPQHAVVIDVYTSVYSLVVTRRFPIAVDARSSLSLGLVDTSVGHIREKEVYLLPVNCWFSPFGNAVHKKRIYFLKDGCPLWKFVNLLEFDNLPQRRIVVSMFMLGNMGGFPLNVFCQYLRCRKGSQCPPLSSCIDENHKRPPYNATDLRLASTGGTIFVHQSLLDLHPAVIVPKNRMRTINKLKPAVLNNETRITTTEQRIQNDFSVSAVVGLCMASFIFGCSLVFCAWFLSKKCASRRQILQQCSVVSEESTRSRHGTGASTSTAMTELSRLSSEERIRLND